MSFTLMREKQKIIVWVIALLIIPTMIFVFSGGNTGTQDGGAPFIRIDGRTVSDTEFYDFVRRMRMVNPYMQYQDSPDYISYVGMMMLKVDRARKAGLGVSDAEIGENIRQHPFCREFVDKDGKFDIEGYREMLKRRSLSPTSFRQAIEENLLIFKFDRFIDSMNLVSPYEAYMLWAMTEAKVIYDEVKVNIGDYTEDAKTAIGDMDAAVEGYLAEHAGDRNLLTPGHWKLEYMAAPFDKMVIESTPPRQKAEEYFHTHKEEYSGKVFVDVQGEINKILVEQARKEAALQLIDRIDDALQYLAGQEGETTADLVLDKLKELKKQKERGTLQAGVMETALTADEIESHPVLGGSAELVSYLRAIENMEDDKERNAMLAEVKRIFNSRVGKDGDRHNMAGKTCAFKIRAVEYEPGVARDPKTDKEFYAEISSRLVDDKAGELARDAALELRQKIVEKDTEGINFESKTEGLAYAPQTLRNPETVIGVPCEPLPSPSGFSILVLRARNIPTYTEYNQQPTEIRESHRRYALMQIRRNYRGKGERMQAWQEDNWTNAVQILVKFKSDKEKKDG